ncbi:hypothetical protein BLNAU_5102 [Blattamonas nauphoetae]|uniref:Uncharacterized protein n=1 Tax=Blattamonas nauphoetae TaxID=2049346 RepID=A0ABQ9Y832_9EUKA|nr:hypothetical protein BLNAU_5102 [Blattamonas nauphoetae]
MMSAAGADRIWISFKPFRDLGAVTQFLTSFILANVPEITLTPQRDGTVVDEMLEPKIGKMLQLMARTAYFQTGELVCSRRT